MRALWIVALLALAGCAGGRIVGTPGIGDDGAPACFDGDAEISRSTAVPSCTGAYRVTVSPLGGSMSCSSPMSTTLACPDGARPFCVPVLPDDLASFSARCDAWADECAALGATECTIPIDIVTGAALPIMPG